MKTHNFASSFGIDEKTLNIIKTILLPFKAKIDKVGVFGSRATGTFRHNSDIDLVIFGNITEKEIDSLYTLFNESQIAIKVDVIAYNLISNPALKQHIDGVMKPIFTKKDLG
jgi:predicted nucleotidyltransferase